MVGQMDGEMDRWIDGKIKERKQVDECADGLIDGWNDGCMDEWTDGRIDGWMD